MPLTPLDRRIFGAFILLWAIALAFTAWAYWCGGAKAQDTHGHATSGTASERAALPRLQGRLADVRRGYATAPSGLSWRGVVGDYLPRPLQVRCGVDAQEEGAITVRASAEWRTFAPDVPKQTGTGILDADTRFPQRASDKGSTQESAHSTQPLSRLGGTFWLRGPAFVRGPLARSCGRGQRVNRRGAAPAKASEPHTISRVVASWYGAAFAGKPMAGGGRFDPQKLTCAHRRLKFGTKLRVCRRGACVVVVVRDRGPFVRGRELDLSEAAARRLGMLHIGVARITMEEM
jgi:rare lipoprotein A (peptidoglycan hydrolase)